MRNPWQFNFDPETGDLYIADVGQVTWEEINFQPAGSPGGQNYGWDHQESGHCYPATVAECPRSQIGTLPVAEYKHGEDGCSITGIGVYRGEEFPSLDGIYFNSDWCTGKFWGLARDDDGAWIYQQLLDTGLLVTGSGVDETGNLYAPACACEFSRQYDPFENPQGTVWRIVAADQVPEAAETAPVDVAAEAATPNSEDAEAATSAP